MYTTPHHEYPYIQLLSKWLYKEKSYPNIKGNISFNLNLELNNKSNQLRKSVIKSIQIGLNKDN